MPALSIVIPTRDRPGLLADCLATLARQAADPGQVEVIVIDDGSDPPLREVVETAAAASPVVEVRYAAQQPGGLNAGRNRGVEESRADLLAFLDDDTLVDQGWAAALLAGFDQRGADAIAGRIRLRLEGTAPRWLGPRLRMYLSELDLGDQARWLEPDASPFGANCAVRRRALEQAGGFRVGLDRVGTSLVSNGDTEFFARVRAGGGRILYLPDAVVEHRVPPERLTAAWFRRRARAQGISDVAVAGSAPAPLPGLAREALRAARVGPILVRSLAAGRGIEPAVIWLAYCRGRAAALRSGGDAAVA